MFPGWSANGEASTAKSLCKIYILELRICVVSPLRWSFRERTLCETLNFKCKCGKNRFECKNKTALSLLCNVNENAVRTLHCTCYFFQAHHVSCSEVLGPKPQGLLHDPAPGARSAHRPVSLGRPHERPAQRVGRGRRRRPRVGARQTARTHEPFSEHRHLHQLLTDQLIARVGKYVAVDYTSDQHTGKREKCEQRFCNWCSSSFLFVIYKSTKQHFCAFFSRIRQFELDGEHRHGDRS